MKKQLQIFIDDFACGGAIRHLADLGLTVPEISKKLSFPMSQEKVSSIVWNHYLEQGIILLSAPDTYCGKNKKISYVEEYDKYGKKTLRQVVKYIDLKKEDYLVCSFGKEAYQDKALFDEKIFLLTKKEQEYILSLPWPLTDVFHKKNEFICNLLEKWNSSSHTTK